MQSLPRRECKYSQPIEIDILENEIPLVIKYSLPGQIRLLLDYHL